ncbi:MAG: lipase maturation factor family protein [Acidobacteriaceae bacterium]|nr:lipase maturation factor family protein [Acidobacteriaceae bacterium]
MFLRLLGLIYIAAFASLWPQVTGLIGSRGIVPAGQALTAMRDVLGYRALFEAPTLFWFGISDAALVWFCALGCVAGAALVVGRFARTAAAACFVLYLSLVTAGQPFMGFQWDALLLESGFLALFSGLPWLVWAYRFCLFRLMFESGVVKLLSHDPAWRSLRALRFHFLTQPLPNPLAYYAYRLPPEILDWCTAATLMIELVCPFLLFAPGRIRHTAATLLIFLQILIILTGNYAFFNLLTLAICLWAFDDRSFAPLSKLLNPPLPLITNPTLRRALAAALVFLLAIGALQVIGMFVAGSRPIRRLLGVIAPFQIVNSYGLFAVMTTSRPEIVLEGSEDQVHWHEYSFKYKPGELHRGLPMIAPYQPRLDWQMWFAALGIYQENSWVSGLMYRLMTGSEPVIKLINPPPFQTPPRYMRALVYDYKFTTPAERERSGAVWRRKLIGNWFGPVSLSGQ